MLAYIDPGPPEKRVIAQLNHELDVIHDIAPEGMFTLTKQRKTTQAWFKGFPFAPSRSDLPAVIFNTQNDLFQNRDVRWALALLIDIKAVSMASYRGAATHIGDWRTRRPAPIRTTYHHPLEEWLDDFEIDTGKRKIKPYDPEDRQADRRHAAALHGRADPDRSRRRSPRRSACGWWKTDPQAATELLEKAGFTKRGGAWITPDGKPFSIKLMVEGDLRPVMTRAGTMIVQQWRQSGIDAKIEVAQGTTARRGAPPAISRPCYRWSVET